MAFRKGIAVAFYDRNTPPPSTLPTRHFEVIFFDKLPARTDDKDAVDPKDHSGHEIGVRQPVQMKFQVEEIGGLIDHPRAWYIRIQIRHWPSPMLDLESRRKFRRFRLLSLPRQCPPYGLLGRRSYSTEDTICPGEPDPRTTSSHPQPLTDARCPASTSIQRNAKKDQRSNHVPAVLP